MHGDVYPAPQQGVVNLLGEEALAADVSERLVQDLVARGLDDDDVDGALVLQLREGLLEAVAGLVGLGEGQGAAKGPSVSGGQSSDFIYNWFGCLIIVCLPVPLVLTANSPKKLDSSSLPVHANCNEP